MWQLRQRADLWFHMRPWNTSTIKKEKGEQAPVMASDENRGNPAVHDVVVEFVFE